MDMLGEIEAVHEEENHLFGFSYHAAKDFFIAGISDPSNPGDFFEIQRKAEAHVRLTDVNNEFLKKVDISIPEPLSFKAEDGWEIQGWLMRPAQFEEGQQYPLVLEIHGGPHACMPIHFSMKCSIWQPGDTRFCILIHVEAMGMASPLWMPSAVTMEEKTILI
ncbi:hypothetical protein [Sinobaca sp. H24]|uniref:alpha/beta hydrolase family protein n=1 Tax=Sinobaca sp. H24 TaxID=2923376 RepID=UPI0020794062|nr:hypothetical protein [Sinobaca sp. H24]